MNFVYALVVFALGEIYINVLSVHTPTIKEHATVATLSVTAWVCFGVVPLYLRKANMLWIVSYEVVVGIGTGAIAGMLIKNTGGAQETIVIMGCICSGLGLAAGAWSVSRCRGKFPRKVFAHH